MSGNFSKLEKGAWGGLLATHSKMMEIIENDLQSRCGISHVEFEILLRLTFAPDNRARIQDLAANSLLTRSGTSRLVDRLEKSGWVTRTKAKEDKRGAYAALTVAGAAKFADARIGHVGLVKDEYLSKYTDDELALLGELLAR